MIDSYMIGTVERISPEAPVPIVHVTDREDRLGGAANVGLNLRALGVETLMAGIVGKDAAGKRLTDLLEKNGIDASCIVSDGRRPTTVKTRIVSNKQQMMRVDEEDTQSAVNSVVSKLFERIEKEVKKGLDVIIFEDYNKGVLTPELITDIIELANENKVLTCVDPKKDNFFKYQGVSLFKPNLKEIREGLGTAIDPSDTTSVTAAADELESRLGNKTTLITLSEHGVFVKSGSETVKVAAHVRNIADVSGAGDTVISVAACCLACETPLKYLAELSNLAGGLVCEIPGVVPVDKDKLKTESLKHANS